MGAGDLRDGLVGPRCCWQRSINWGRLGEAQAGTSDEMGQPNARPPAGLVSGRGRSDGLYDSPRPTQAKGAARGEGGYGRRGGAGADGGACRLACMFEVSEPIIESDGFNDKIGRQQLTRRKRPCMQPASQVLNHGRPAAMLGLDSSENTCGQQWPARRVSGMVTPVRPMAVDVQAGAAANRDTGSPSKHVARRAGREGRGWAILTHRALILPVHSAVRDPLSVTGHGCGWRRARPSSNC